MHCKVMAIDSPRRLAHELEPTTENRVAGTRLRFEHSGFDLSRQIYQVAYNGIGDGWRQIIGPGPEAVLRRIQAEAGS